MDKSSVWIVIPAYNEAKRIGAVLEHLKNKGYANLIVVNDGSQDNTAGVASEHTQHVLSHVINRGAGAATKTGLEYAKQQDASVIVTLDADGQHAVDDLELLVQPILENKADVV
ncbi:MAG: glycosyltransferase family 2 protein, partial [Candidatus Woesearchaeota archaeon]|nr:glycosyltransferase family 2 protein [Candidatus Woesearchaeota archaeon]